MTLTKDQKRHRRRQKNSLTDTHRAVSSGGHSTRHVSDRNLTVRISLAAFEKLSALAEKEGKSKSDELEHIISTQIEKRSHQTSGDHPAVLKMHEEDMNQDGLSFRYRAEKESKKISYWISANIWNKLHAEKTHSKLSKARLVESIIMNYTPVSDEVRAKAREAYAEMRETYGYATDRSSRERWIRPDSQCSSEHLFNRNMKRGESMSVEEFEAMLAEQSEQIRKSYDRQFLPENQIKMPKIHREE